MSPCVAERLPLCWPVQESAWPKDADGAGLAWAALDARMLARVAEVEKTAYRHPWSERHFRSSLDGGHLLRALVCAPGPTPPPNTPALPDGRWLLGYLVAMAAADEVHLLNITTVPMHQRQGLGHCMLDTLALAARCSGAQTLWLEVRAGNAPALALYQAQGFQAVGRRKGYYPDSDARREDAIVMTLPLTAPARPPVTPP